MKLIDVVQRLKLVSDYDQCRKAMDDAIDEITKLREQLALRDLEMQNIKRYAEEVLRISDGEHDACDVLKQSLSNTFTPTHLQELIKVQVTSALEKAYECNESNGYHNSWDMDLIIDAVVEEFKA